MCLIVIYQDAKIFTFFFSFLVNRFCVFLVTVVVMSKDENIGFNGYIDTWILRIYKRYIDEYFYMSIDIS